LELEGRVDRIVRAPDGALRVGDYKTSRDFAKPVAPKRVMRGTSLQVPLYALVVATERNTPVIGEACGAPAARATPTATANGRSLSSPTSRPGLPVLRELHDLLARGLFPFWRDREECRFCAYTIACRREHGPSRERLASSDALASWLALRGGAGA
jgi:RecB family exonuclease